MEKDHFPRGTTYRVIPQKNLTYAVELTEPRHASRYITGFSTEDEAAAWIASEQQKTRAAG